MERLAKRQVKLQMGETMKSIKQTLKRMAVAAATTLAVIGGVSGIAAASDGPAEIVAVSPVGRAKYAKRATTYVYAGRTRVNLPDDVLAELDAWITGYMQRIEQWSAEDGEEWDAYYGGLEEGVSCGVAEVLTRLGYVDGTPTSETLQQMPKGWDRTAEGETFLTWENASFGSID